MYYYFNQTTADILLEHGKKEYRYIWSDTDGAFLQYTDCVYDPRDRDPKLGALVASLPMERLPIRKVLSTEITFQSPYLACRRIGDFTDGLPATYGKRPLIFHRLADHAMGNGAIINVLPETFQPSEPERYQFAEHEDGLIMSLIDSDANPIEIPTSLETSPGRIVVTTPYEAKAIIAELIRLSR